jgi:hypothetical protein
MAMLDAMNAENAVNTANLSSYNLTNFTCASFTCPSNGTHTPKAAAEPNGSIICAGPPVIVGDFIGPACTLEDCCDKTTYTCANFTCPNNGTYPPKAEPPGSINCSGPPFIVGDDLWEACTLEDCCDNTTYTCANFTCPSNGTHGPKAEPPGSIICAGPPFIVGDFWEACTLEDCCDLPTTTVTTTTTTILYELSLATILKTRQFFGSSPVGVNNLTVPTHTPLLSFTHFVIYSTSQFVEATTPVVHRIYDYFASVTTIHFIDKDLDEYELGGHITFETPQTAMLVSLASLSKHQVETERWRI